MTRQQLENKYNVKLFKDFGFDDSRKYWVCMKDEDYFCDGWTLKEIESKLKKEDKLNV